MAFQPWRLCRALTGSVALLLLLVIAPPSQAAEKPRLRVDDYQIDAELTPHTHRIAATAKVKFTALEDLNVATFELNNAMRVNKVLDAAGKPLSAERVTQDFTVRVQLPNGLPKDSSTTLTFDYEGILDSAEDSPVQGLKLASVNDDTSYLLYAGRWFPVNGYGLNRFTATINVTVPAHMVVIGSGKQTVADVPPKKGVAGGLPLKTYTFVWDKPSFPGTIVAGQFQEFKSDEAGLDLHVFFKPVHQNQGATYAETAVKEFTYYVTLYGPAPSTTLRVVEIPDDTVPTAWAPEMAALASRGITDKINYRLLANTIAHQWWGASVSPDSRDDWWLEDGFARYSEALYVENAAGPAGLEEAVKDMSVGALAYDTVPLSSAGKLDLFSPEFQSLVTDKGAMILHMLRWVMGEQKFNTTMRAFAAKYAGKSASVNDFQALAEQNYGDKLTWFFTQWLDSTGAPEFKTKYTVYRLGSGKGFRVVGQIAQDLDLFRMPVELKIDTDGKTEEKRIDVVGTDSPFSVETFGRPRRIVIDPDNRVLKNSTEIKLRASIMRGQALVQQGDLAGALSEFNKALEVNKNSSLAHYRVAEVFYLQHNYQAAANAYRSSLNGDGDPRWTEVWCHIQLGKIFDITGQRERATNEYRQALQTNDNTQGALDEARKYLQKPFEQAKNSGG
ncbi:MAG TPA: M1 family aminopeptidase [Terriglobales bacterium]|jgi:tetratricopeptide (TPR) repeat protein|nr:M1 family aminopeptidase [Terriglobales bacterium]